MILTWDFTAALPHLDIHTLSEDWMLAAGMEAHWKMLADSVGKRPSEWRDTQGERMYGAVIWLETRFDLENTIHEDDLVSARTEIVAIRKPHALSVTRFSVGGGQKAELSLLTSFIKRQQRGSNKRFSKVRDLWTAPDLNGAQIDALLEEHHLMKSRPDHGVAVRPYEVNRIQDFNTADFLYFKNFVRIAKAAEWVQDRSGPPQLCAHRRCFYYGNVDDGDVIETRIGPDPQGGRLTTHYDPTGKRIFLCRSLMQPVTLALR